MSDLLGQPRVHLRRTDSTNERARALALAGAPHGTLVTAAEQTAGRGRQGRSWSAPAGRALLMSLVLREPPPLLPVIAGIAVCRAADELLGEGAARVQVKWPNDVVLGAGPDEPLRKLAGILAEGRPQDGWAILGIGLNVALRVEDLPEDLRGRAATLGLEPDALPRALAAVLGDLESALADPLEASLAAWRERDALRGREIVWAGGRGRAEGIDGVGRLVVARAQGGRETLDAGEVHLRLDDR